MDSEDGPIPKEFPDVTHKLSAPKKLSAFEKERLQAEEKKRRAEAETAAALREFEDSFGGQDADEDDFDGFPKFRSSSGPRGGGGGGSGGMGYGGRYGGPRSGPGSLGPPPGMQPPSLKRKRALDEMREAQIAARESEDFASEYGGRRRERGYSPAQDDDREDVAPKPTVQLSSLPPSMTADEVTVLLRDHLPVHSVQFQSSGGPPPMGKRSLTAIATLAAETSTTQIDAAVSALKDKYLGNGFRLSISRHLSSTSLLPSISSAPSAASAEPFGAQKVNKDQPGRFSMRNAPPPSEFAPPDSYDSPSRPLTNASAVVSVHPPLDINIIRAVHTIVDRLLSEPDFNRAIEIEAMLMALPEVQDDERFSFLYDSRSPAGVYYRFLLWNDDENFESIQERKRLARGPERIIDDVVIDWIPPYEEVPFADLSKLGEVIDHINYETSDEESDDGDGERRFNNGRREGEGPPESSDKKHLTPLQVAKFAWLLSRMPASNTKLRKGDIAPVTAFAINHAGAGAEEIVDMLVLNVEKPYTTTQCAKFDHEDVSQDDDDVYEPDVELPTIETAPVQDASSREDKRDTEDISQAKLVALYIINDVLHNSSTAGVRNAWKYRTLFENAFKRQKTFEHLGHLEKELGWGRIKAEKWQNRIRALFEIWEKGSVFATDVFDILKKNFFDQPVDEAETKTEDGKKPEWMGRFKRIDGKNSPGNSASPAPQPVVLPPAVTNTEGTEAEVDGEPIDDVDGEPIDDIDGEPMDDVDGEPMDDLDGEPMDDPDGVPMEDAPMKDAPPAQIAAEKAPEQTAPEPRRRKLAEDMFADSDEE